MVSADIPPDVVQLLTTTVTSATQLEVLLFLHAHPLAEWSGKGVAEVLGLDRHVADAILDRLHGQGFLSVRDTPSHLYQYSPNDQFRESTDHLARVFAEQKFAVLTLILSNRATDSLRTFSDAFRFRPEKKEP